MAVGIQICGLNGCGKSTLGRALAEKIGFHFIDNENLYFGKADASDPYANPKTRKEAELLLMEEVRRYPDFIFSAVKGDYGEDIIPMYSYVVVIEAPKEIRSQRVRNRSFQKFGSRMLTGGDLFSREEAFFRMSDSRSDDYIADWLQKVSCPVIRVDGTKPVEENVEYILQVIGQ